jgi:hypothetical protein
MKTALSVIAVATALILAPFIGGSFAVADDSVPPRAGALARALMTAQQPPGPLPVAEQGRLCHDPGLDGSPKDESHGEGTDAKQQGSQEAKVGQA